MLGAGEAGRFCDLIHYSTKMSADEDPVLAYLKTKCLDIESDVWQLLKENSLVVAVVSSHIYR